MKKKVSLNYFLSFALIFCGLGGVKTLNAQEINEAYIDSIVSNNLADLNGTFNYNIINLCGKIDRQPDALKWYRYLDSISQGNDLLKLNFYSKYLGQFYRKGDNKTGLKKNTYALNLAEKNNYPRFIFEYSQLKSLGFIYESIADSALFYANQGEKIAFNNTADLGSSLFRIYERKAFIEELLGNLNKQDYYFEKMVESLEPYPNNKNYSYVLFEVIIHFKNEKNYKKHSYYSNKLENYYFNRDYFKTPTAHISLATFLKFESTDENINELKALINNVDSLHQSANSHFIVNDISSKLTDLNRQNEAIEILQNSLKKNYNNITPIDFILSYSNLEAAYLKNNDFENAYKVLRKGRILSDSIRRQKVIEKVADFEVKYETEKKEAQLKVLTLESEKAKEQQQLYFYLAISGLFITSLIGFFLYKNRKKNKLLAQQKKLLEATVDEKNVLLKETHHRVKNSFQIVSSLLYLQSENTQNKEAQSAMKEAQNRVRSMVLIHQKLYSKDQLVGIDTQEYFTDLARDIFESHQFENSRVKYSLDVIPIVLGVETVTPLGLILNELITNVIKHAFNPVTDKSTLHIELKRVEETLQLKVEDNGKGMSSEIKDSSFGIQLIRALSKKLKASLEFQEAKTNGTIAVLKINRFTEL